MLRWVEYGESSRVYKGPQSNYYEIQNARTERVEVQNRHCSRYSASPAGPGFGRFGYGMIELSGTPGSTATMVKHVLWQTTCEVASSVTLGSPWL